MKLVAVTVVLAACLSACASQTNRTPGAELGGSKGIAAVQVTVLADRPASVLINLTKQYFVGAIEGFEVRSGKPVLVFRDMRMGQYSWYDMMTTVGHAPKADLGGRLPDFTIKPGCITPIGKVVIDLRGGGVRVAHSAEDRDQFLAEVKREHAAEMAKYGVCN
jgi:hypothetical protein